MIDDDDFNDPRGGDKMCIPPPREHQRGSGKRGVHARVEKGLGASCHPMDGDLDISWDNERWLMRNGS